MFLRLLWESFARQRRRKLLAGAAILLGTTAVTAMLALATTIGDRIHRELAVYGANIVVTPKAEQLAVKVGGVDIKPATGNAYLKESDLDKLHTIFWANNITGISPELRSRLTIMRPEGDRDPVDAEAVGYWFDHKFGALTTGVTQLHPLWRIQGKWPQNIPQHEVCLPPLCWYGEAALGQRLAAKLNRKPGSFIMLSAGTSNWFVFRVSGIAYTGSAMDDALILTLSGAQLNLGMFAENTISRVEISARTKPEDAFARTDPDTLSPKQREIWYCRPYANSIARQIQDALPGSHAEQVRQVEQTEGTVLARISGLMWLVSGAALLAAGFAVSAAMATAVLERRNEIGLMRSLGASKAAVASLFYAESGLLAVIAGTLGYLAGSALAFWLGGRIFPGASTAPLLNVVLLPVVLGIALVVSIAGSTPSIRRALEMAPSAVLRVDA